MYGAKIRELRKRRGWTMKQLGQMLELAESTISGYENEIRRPDMDALLRFAELFGVSVDYLLGRDASGASASGASSSQTGASADGDEPAPGNGPLRDALRESAAPYYAAIWDGRVEPLTEEEATHLRNSLEMFRLWKANRSSGSE
ncbi:helix-turn-helix transcriptional regulator [Paenibacillus sp.]|uniref:helix-turn-helix domain-containing protein n=1 Tax=Paenibacillus sp. TaxID=58172 RepID=UPI002D6B2959|nr:helix-turn-helix transcriptional regulator [Paenibacillus sp.]HZG57738.1 helix-turn-helix transcriptional regulator [Paenibacillus sp.]